MVMLQFNAEGREGIQEFEPLPAGEYPAMIVDSEAKPIDNNRGNMIVLTFEVTEGPFKNRKFFYRLNLQHDDVETDDKKRQMVEIAQRGLTSICNAIGKKQIHESTELHMQPMTVKLKVDPARKDPTTGKEYGPSNTVANIFPYKPYQEMTQQPVAGGPATAAGPAAPATPPAAPPWIGASSSRASTRFANTKTWPSC